MVCGRTKCCFGCVTRWRIAISRDGFVLLLALAGLVLAETSWAEQPANLAPNGGFEQDVDQDGAPDEWQAEAVPDKDRQATLALDDEVKRSGATSCRVQIHSGSGDFCVRSDPVALDPQGTYLITGWVRAAYLRPVEVHFVERDEQGAEHTRAVRVTAGRRWRPFRLVAARLDRGASRHIALRSPSRQNGAYEHAGKIWLDDVVLRRADSEVQEVLQEPDEETWVPYPMDWRDSGPSALDVTRVLGLEKTGARGFVTTEEDGHFYFEDGTRARFWGVNFIAPSFLPNRQQAESVAKRLARAGVNLVRIHWIEASETGIVDTRGGTSTKFHADRLDRLDYLFYQLHLNGIYVTLDAIPMSRRRIMPADGVDPDAITMNRPGAATGAWFYTCPPIIELEKDFARRLFHHENPYNGKRYCDDPTIAFVELDNEDSLFLNYTGGALPPNHPYPQWWQAWNRFLRRRYKNRHSLIANWSRGGHDPVLGPAEDPEKDSVEVGLTENPIRAADYRRFMYQIQRDHFQHMYRYLRELGVKVPISGTNWMVGGAPNLRSHEGMDFTDQHCYFNKQADPMNEAMVATSPLDLKKTGRRRLVQGIAPAKIAGKPVVSTEWNTPWPNQFRAESMITITAYACLQDWDAICNFVYMGGATALYPPQPLKLSVGYTVADPAEMGLFPLCAIMFRRHDVATARLAVENAISDEDTFRTNTWKFLSLEHSTDLFVPYISRYQKRFFSGTYRPGRNVDLTTAALLSPTGDYSAAHRLVACYGTNPDGPTYTRQSFEPKELYLYDVPEKIPDLVRALVADLGVLRAGTYTVQVPSSLWPDGRLTARFHGLVDARSIPPGLKGLGAETRGAGFLGVIGERIAVVPDARNLTTLEPTFLARLFTYACRRWNLLEEDQGLTDDGQGIVSDTGQLATHWGRGLMTVNAPLTQVASGFLGEAGQIRLKDLAIRCRTDFAVIGATSLDGIPLDRSGHILISAVGRAENRSQQVRLVAWMEGGKPRFRTPTDPKYRPVYPCPSPFINLGVAPVLIEPIEAEVQLSRAPNAEKLACWALDGEGRRTRSVALKLTPNAVTVPLGSKSRSMYYELQAP